MKIVVWQNVLTEHQVHTLRALQAYCKSPIEFVIGTRRHLSAREAQGWTACDYTGLSMHELPPKNWWGFARMILHLYPDAIHIFGGFWENKRMLLALLRAQTLGIKTGFITEPYADAPVSYLGNHPRLSDWLKAYIRPIAYQIGGWLIARSQSPVFAISTKAVKQFKKIGFKTNYIFPFGYFIPQATEQLKPQMGSASLPRLLHLVFIGSLINRKGISVLAEAVIKLNSNGLIAILDLYGSGDPSAFTSKSEHIKFKGLIPFGEAQSIIAAYDILILPSLHDGWGVVVNEALLQGVPVIASDAVGACTLIEVSGAGAIFPSGNSDKLNHILSEVAQSSSKLNTWRKAALNFRHMIAPEIAGKYMYDCLHYTTNYHLDRPIPYWYPH